MLKKIPLLIFILYALLPSTIQPYSKTQSSEQTWITIFVHGIIGIKPHLTFTNFFRMMQDQISSTVYARTIELTRNDPFFFKNHPMKEIGLQPVDITHFGKGDAAELFAYYYDQFQRKLFPSQQDNHYYTYGWSGLLSRKMRYHEAELFYESIIRLRDSFIQKGITPKIRIIGYSHGGDFSLKLATINHLHHEESLYIDELILLGVPVLPEAHELIQDATFKKIYHIYSYGDRVQKVDFFSSQHLFSHRTFKETAHFCIPESMTQINLQIKRPIFSKRRMCHDDYLCKRHIRSMDPGHTELWSFGWTPQSYREHFPLYPFPAGIFIPYIIYAAHNPCLPKTNNYIVDIRPYNQSMLVKTKRPIRNRETFCMHFVSGHELERMGHDILQYKPDNFTLAEYNRHIAEHLNQAEAERKPCPTLPKRCKRRTTKTWAIIE